MFDIAATEDRLVIVGFDEEHAMFGNTAVWTSADGFIWTQQTLGGEMRMVEGTQEEFEGVGTRGMWKSLDGLRWERTDPGDLRLAWVSGLTRTPGGLVAVGSSAGDRPAAWTLADGAAWAPAIIESWSEGGEWWGPKDVAAADSGLAAVAGPGDMGGSSAILVSEDGTTWVHDNAPEDVSEAGLRAIAPFGSHFVAIGGWSTTWTTRSPTIWTTFEPTPQTPDAVRDDDPGSAESTTYPPIELPAEIPEGIESGTLETPLGPARWLHLTGDETSIPRELSGLLSDSDGSVVPEWSDPWWGGGEAELWRSPDLISWTSEPLGIEARWGELSRAGGTYWLNVHEPGSLWRSPDTKSWEQVSLEGLVPPGPDGYAWTLRPGRPLTHGGVTIVPFEWVADEWVVARQLPGADQLRAVTLLERSPGVFDIDDSNAASFNRGTFATVRFEETEDGLRVLDHEDGTELKVLEDVSMEFIKLLTYRFDGDDLIGVESEFDEIAWQPLPRLAMLDGSMLEEVEPPLEGEEQAFTEDEEGFVSVTLGLDGLVHVHRSRDGREWSEIDVLGDEADEPTDIGRVWTERGFMWIGNSTDFWWSTDGLVWERDPDEGLPLGDGRVEGPMTMAGSPVFHPEEGVPVGIDITETRFNLSDCGGGGDTLLSPNTMASYVIDEECTGGDRELLIITFNDIPA